MNWKSVALGEEMGCEEDLELNRYDTMKLDARYSSL